MPRLIERISSRSTSEEVSSKQKSASRTFVGPAIRSDADALAAFYQEGHEVYPGDESLKLISVSSAPMDGAAGYEVTASYGNRSTRFSQPPRDETGYFHFGWQTQDRKVTLPFSQRVRLVVSDEEPDGVLVWAIRSVEHTDTRLIRPFTVRVTGVNIASFDVIASEKRKIHTIGGRDYLYLGGEVAEVDGSAYDVTHTWEIDRGTPYVADNNRNRIDVDYPIVGTVGDVEMMRLPYTETLAIPSDDPLNEPHRYVSFYPYPRSPDGWRQLPGAQLL